MVSAFHETISSRLVAEAGIGRFLWSSSMSSAALSFSAEMSNQDGLQRIYRLLWLKTKCYKKWKLLVYDAVITSKFLYDLKTLKPTAAAANLLNTFQLEGLRKMLNFNTIYVQRRNTNEYVYQKANEAVSAPRLGPDRKIEPLTEVLEQRKQKLLGHVLRRERQHPQHQVTFATASAMPREP